MSDFKRELLEFQQILKSSFNRIKANPLDLNTTMNHIGNLSLMLDAVMTHHIGPTPIFDLHMDMLTRTPEKYNRPQVSDIGPWRALGQTIKAASPRDLANIPTGKLYFWSDQHYGHKNIIAFSNRPYKDLDEMHEALVENYNKVVGPDDVCVWIGDVSFRGATETNIWLDRFNGYKIQVVGNHDIDHGKLKLLNFDEIHTSLAFADYVVTHHPWVEFLPDHLTCIHGHLHDRPFYHERHLCACVELTDYKPVSLSELYAKYQYITQNQSLLQTLGK